MSDATEVPDGIRRLRCDVRGAPVPWFALWMRGVPDRVHCPSGMFERAMAGRRCWFCGDPMGPLLAFIGPTHMLFTRCAGAPPVHPDCARYAATHADFYLDAVFAATPDRADASCTICAVFVTRKCWLENAGGARLVKLGEPVDVTWFSPGPPAARREVVAALDRVKQIIERRGNGGEYLDECFRVAMRWAPPAPEKEQEDG